LIIEIEKQDSDILLLLSNKISCARLALRNPASGFSEEEKKFYWQASIDALGQYQWLYNDEWKRITKKYNLEPEKKYWLREDKLYAE